MKSEIGVIGLAVMGGNLALNMADHGFAVSVFNITRDLTDTLMSEYKGDKLVPTYSLQELVDSLTPPRRIWMMIRAGEPVDQTIQALLPLLDKGDILIDGGNSYYQDTIRRCTLLESRGLRYVGAGVSGGAEGARFGPAVMPGGTRDAYAEVAPIMTAIAAKVDSQPCCTYMGENGAGHFVKMVHNGIEYGDMQLICEAYALLSKVLGLRPAEMSGIFQDWNRGELDSYLIGITGEILAAVDQETGQPMVDVILDAAGEKGTGKWTSRESLDLGVPTPTIAEAVYARFLSARREERLAASKAYGRTETLFTGDRAVLIESVRRALYCGKICSYAQGFALMAEAGRSYGWTLDFGGIAMVFRGGCIIRAQFLQTIKDAFDSNPQLPNLLMDGYFKDILLRYRDDFRRVAALAVEHSVHVPAILSALSYFDGYTSERSSANLLQAQRDYFGAHTFRRVDRAGDFHHEWY